VREFGHPVCIVSAGIHDISIPNIKIQDYIQNVDTYLHLLARQCSHVIWLGNTSPKTNDFVQQINQTQTWNLAVLNTLLNSHQFSKMSSFVDVFVAASKTVVHRDNIHMEGNWYDALGKMFLDKESRIPARMRWSSYCRYKVVVIKRDRTKHPAVASFVEMITVEQEGITFTRLTIGFQEEYYVLCPMNLFFGFRRGVF
jgi:hypothetical protein